MSEPVRLRVRCDERTRKLWRKAAAADDMNYGEFAYWSSQFILENESLFKEYVEKEGRVRTRSRR